MSYYYNFYIGYKERGKIYPYGPYDCDGNLYSIINLNGYYQCDIIDRFEIINNIKKSVSKKALTEIHGDNYEPSKYDVMRVLPYKELPKGSYMKKGYFLVDVVRDYEENGEYGELYGGISQLEYTVLLEKELKFGKPKKEKNEFGEWYIPKTASDYMFYVYPDYNCEEYYASEIRSAVRMIENYYSKKELVVFTTEG